MIDTILQHITYIPLRVDWFARQSRLGLHKSRHRGTGLEFDQIVEYREGESIRKINWAATARRGGNIPFINTYYEEKSITLMLMVDMSASMDFGSARLTKKSLAAEISASLVYSALATHNSVGLLGFAAGATCYVPPRHCKAYQRAIPESILMHEPSPVAASFPAATAALERVLKRRAVVFILSDFITDDHSGLEYSLRRLNHGHDVIALVVTDRLEVSHPCGHTRMVTRDLESGHIRSYSLTRRNQQQMALNERTRREQMHQLFQRMGIAYLTVTAQSDYGEALGRLLLTRHRKASA